MARRFTSGFELAEAIEHNSTISQAGFASTAVQGTTKRTGDYGLKLDAANQVNTAYWFFTQVFADHPTELYCRLALYIATAMGASANLTNILAFLDDAGNVHGAVGFEAADNLLRFNIGGTGVLGQTGGTIQATSSVPLAANQWYIVEVRFKVDNAAGVATIRVNGTTVASFTGDTQTGANAYIHLVRVGANGVGAASAADIYLDDVAMNDTTGTQQNSWPSFGGVYLLKPTAEGASSAWTPSTGTDNSALVDEVPANDSDYVSATASGTKDTCVLEDLPADVNTVAFVEWVMQAGLSEAGSNTLRSVIRHSAVDYDGTPDYTITNLAPAWAVLKGDPVYEVLGGAGLWSVAQVNALEAGMKIV